MYQLLLNCIYGHAANRCNMLQEKELSTPVAPKRFSKAISVFKKVKAVDLL